MNPGLARLERNRVVLRVYKMNRSHQACRLLPFAAKRGPLHVKYLSIPEQMGKALLSKSEVDFELIMPEALVLCE